MADSRAVRPLDPKATQAADEAIYAKHAIDPRPNALYDANGQRQLLSATDPAQADLRKEWMDAYEANGGKVEQPGGGKKPGDIAEPCPDKELKANLTVEVRYTPLDAPVEGATVKIDGPVSQTEKTDAAGQASFKDLPPGDYTIDATYDERNTLVDYAKSHVGKTDWAYANERPPYPANTNKCNLFVHEMLTDTGYAPPLRTYKRCYGYRDETGYCYGYEQDISRPILAGEWADPNDPISMAPTIADPKPGDIIAYSHQYSDATGHVGIVGYPKPAETAQKTLAAGESASETLTMERQTISAGAATVDENDSIWRKYDADPSVVVFRRPTK